jgi:hypothetical protein
MSANSSGLRKISLEEWDRRYTELRAAGLREPTYGGPLRRHLVEGRDKRLGCLEFDPSPAALRLWNFLLSEEDRLHQARQAGQKLVRTMKDLGTVPVLAYASPRLVAFYPDGAWWIPCVMELSDGAEAIVVSRIPGASHCAYEARIISEVAQKKLDLPVLELEVPPVSDTLQSNLRARLEALVETVRARRL